MREGGAEEERGDWAKGCGGMERSARAGEMRRKERERERERERCGEEQDERRRRKRHGNTAEGSLVK